MLSAVLNTYEWHQVRLGAVANPPEVPGPGVAIFASEQCDDAALEIRYKITRAANAPNAVKHALRALKEQRRGHVAFVAPIPKEKERERLVSDLRAAIARRG